MENIRLSLTKSLEEYFNIKNLSYESDRRIESFEIEDLRVKIWQSLACPFVTIESKNITLLADIGIIESLEELELVNNEIDKKVFLKAQLIEVIKALLLKR